MVVGGRTAQEIFNDNSSWIPPDFTGVDIDHNVCSFQSMLANLISQVIPRSLQGLDGDGFLQSLIEKQITDFEKALMKLTRKTMFET